MRYDTSFSKAKNMAKVFKTSNLDSNYLGSEDEDNENEDNSQNSKDSQEIEEQLENFEHSTNKSPGQTTNQTYNNEDNIVDNNPYIPEP